MSGNIIFFGKKIFENSPFFQTRLGDLGRKVHACSLRFSTLNIKPPPGAYLFQFHLRRGLNRDGGLIWEGGGLFNLEKTMVSVLHKELQYKVGKLKNKKVGGHAAKDQNQIRTSSW